MWTVKALLSRAWKIPVSLLALPVTIPLHVAGFRRLPVITQRIGHLTAEIDCFLKEQRMGQLPHRHWFVLAPKRRVANGVILDYWRPCVRVLMHPAVCAIVEAATHWGPMVHPIHDYVLGLSGSGRYYRVNADWGDRAPLLTLTDEHRAAGEAALRHLGIPEGAWYVCLHAREGGYSQEDERVHSYRNSDVLRLIPTIEYIVSRGGWCVRMGDPSMEPLPRMRGLVDYAHHPLRSPLLDVFLCATCRIFLGNTSGLFLVSTAFGVPSVLANMIPITSMGFGPRDLSIPKLLWSVRKRGYLTFAEVLRSGLANARISAAFRDAGVEPVENTAEDIRDLAAEMLDHIEGRGTQYEEFAPLQKRFARLLRPNHFCYGTRSRIGARFAHKYQDLLTQ